MRPPCARLLTGTNPSPMGSKYHLPREQQSPIRKVLRLAVAVLRMWVVAPQGEISPLAPSGAVVAEDYLNHLLGRQRLALSAESARYAEQMLALRRVLYYLRSRFPSRLSVYWVNPWSLHGLWFCWRNRVRSIPVVLFSRWAAGEPTKYGYGSMA